MHVLTCQMRDDPTAVCTCPKALTIEELAKLTGKSEKVLRQMYDFSQPINLTLSRFDLQFTREELQYILNCIAAQMGIAEDVSLNFRVRKAVVEQIEDKCPDISSADYLHQESW